jgi:hypothetical protein
VIARGPFFLFVGLLRNYGAEAMRTPSKLGPSKQRPYRGFEVKWWRVAGEASLAWGVSSTDSAPGRKRRQAAALHINCGARRCLAEAVRYKINNKFNFKGN